MLGSHPTSVYQDSLLKRVAKIFLWAATLLLTFGQLQRVQISLNIGVYVHELAMGVVICTGIVAWVIKSSPRELLRQMWQNNTRKSFLFFCFFNLLVGIFSTQQTIFILYWLRALYYFCFYLVLLKGYEWKWWDQVFLRRLCVLSLGILLMVGWWQYLFLPDTRFLHGLGWDDHYYRLISTTFDPGITGLLLIFLLDLLIENFVKRPKFFSYNSMLISIVSGAIYLTLSRAAWLSLLIYLSILSYKKGIKGTRRILCLILVSLAMTGGITRFLFADLGGEGQNIQRTATVSLRWESIKLYLGDLSGSDWIWGKGLYTTLSDKIPHSSDFPMRAQVSDNWLVFLLHGSGLIGLSFFLFQWQNWFFKPIRSGENHMPLSLLSLVVLCHSLFQATLLHPFVWYYLSLIGLSKKKA